jgi:hypothetical protein
MPPPRTASRFGTSVARKGVDGESAGVMAGGPVARALPVA